MSAREWAQIWQRWTLNRHDLRSKSQPLISTGSWFSRKPFRRCSSHFQPTGTFGMQNIAHTCHLSEEALNRLSHIYLFFSSTQFIIFGLYFPCTKPSLQRLSEEYNMGPAGSNQRAIKSTVRSDQWDACKQSTEDNICSPWLLPSIWYSEYTISEHGEC